MKNIFTLLCVLVLLTPAFSAKASEDFVSLSAGYFDFLDDDKAADFRLEYRWNTPFFWVVKPFAGMEFTSDGAAYGLGGLLLDIPVKPHWYFTPSFGAGLYHDGDGIDLGHTLQFRTQLEMAYEFESRDRLSLAFSHISNASLDGDNPGTEIVSLYYHMPLSRIWGK